MRANLMVELIGTPNSAKGATGMNLTIRFQISRTARTGPTKATDTKVRNGKKMKILRHSSTMHIRQWQLRPH